MPGNPKAGTIAVDGHLDRFLDRPLEGTDRPRQSLPRHAARLPRDDGGHGVDLLLACLLVHEEHHGAVALVDRPGILASHHKAHPVQRNAAVLPFDDLEPEHELAGTVVGHPAELAVTPVTAVTALDVMHLHPIRHPFLGGRLG